MIWVHTSSLGSLDYFVLLNLCSPSSCHGLSVCTRKLVIMQNQRKMLRAKYGMMSSLELLFTRCATSEEWWWVIGSPLCTMGDVQPSSSWSRRTWCWKEPMQPGVRPFPRRLFSEVNRTSKASLYPPAPAHRLLASLNGPFTTNGSPRKQLPVLRILAPSVTRNLIMFICSLLQFLSVDTVLSGRVSSFLDLMMVMFSTS